MNEETQNIGEIETQIASAVRLPLWKNCVEKMLSTGIEHGKTYPAEFFETELRCKRDDLKFGFAVAEIRRALELRGYFLSGRGLKGDSFVILPVDGHLNVLSNYALGAMDLLSRGVILGTNTRKELLNAEQKRRLESKLEKMSWQLIMLRKPMQIRDAVKKARPKLLTISA